jgi:hypothetical protein
VCDCAVAGGEPGADFVGVIVKWPHAAAIRDAAGFVDDVEALGPGGVRVVGGVGEVVDTEGNGVMEALDEIVGDGHSLRESLWLGVADVVLHVRLHLPFVRGVSFADVNGQKVGVIFVVVVKLDHVTDVAAKWRSSVAAEDDDERAAASAFANVEMIGAVESDEPRVGSVVADFQIAAAHVRQGIAHHAVSILGAAGHFAENEERGDQQQQKNGNRPFPEKTHRYKCHSLFTAAKRNTLALRDE